MGGLRFQKEILKIVWRWRYSYVTFFCKIIFSRSRWWLIKYPCPNNPPLCFDTLLSLSHKKVHLIIYYSNFSFKFGTKFGAEPADTMCLLHAAKQLKLNVVGVRYIYPWKLFFIFHRFQLAHGYVLIWTFQWHNLLK